MGLLDRFKKKDDEPLDLDSGLPPLDSGMDMPKDPLAGNDPLAQDPIANPALNPSNELPQGTPRMNTQASDFNPFPQQSGGQQFPQQGMSQDFQKDLQLISSKLDMIKSELDSMDQRIRNIEKIAEGEKDKHGKFVSKDPWGKY